MNSMIWTILLGLTVSTPVWANIPPPETPISWDQVKQIAEQSEIDIQEVDSELKKKIKPFEDRKNKTQADASSAKANCRGDFDCIKNTYAKLQEALNLIEQESQKLNAEYWEKKNKLPEKYFKLLDTTMLFGVLGEIEKQLKAQEKMGTFTLDSQIKTQVFHRAEELESFLKKEGITLPALTADAIFRYNTDEVIVFQYFITKPQEGNPDRFETFQITGMILDANQKHGSSIDAQFRSLLDLAKSGTAPAFSTENLGAIFSTPQKMTNACHLYTKTSEVSACAYNIDVKRIGF